MIIFDESFHTKQTKEEVAGTLEAVQTIQSITQALQKSKENYNAKCVEQERLKKEGATQREIEKVIIIKIIPLWFQSTVMYKTVFNLQTFKNDLILKIRLCASVSDLPE